MTDGWTLSELVERAARALEAHDVRAPNGRVTEFPDARVIRWYATIGLVDRPSAMRGRTALYETRHLLQLVAVKRRQAQGRALAEIQRELAGATNATLHRVAGLASEALANPVSATSAEPITDEATGAAGIDAATGAGDAAIRLPLRPAKSGTRRPTQRFWARPAQPSSAESIHHGPAFHAQDANATDTVRDDCPGTVSIGLHAIGLNGDMAIGADVLLVLRKTPDGDDVAAIRAAAQPLLDLLVQRGLITQTPPTGQKTPTPQGGQNTPQGGLKHAADPPRRGRTDGRRDAPDDDTDRHPGDLLNVESRPHRRRNR